MILEIRTYRLKPGTTDEFVRVMDEEAVPMLVQHGITVVDYGASLVREQPDWEEAYIMRAFPSLEAHQQQEEAFYSSQEWLEGPREAVISRIESYHTVVIETTQTAIDALTRE